MPQSAIVSGNTAGGLLPADPMSKYLFVVAVARDCATIQALLPKRSSASSSDSVPCLEIDKQDLRDSKGFSTYDRTYLNPTTRTGPSSDELQPYTILSFSSPSSIALV